MDNARQQWLPTGDGRIVAIPEWNGYDANWRGGWSLVLIVTTVLPIQCYAAYHQLFPCVPLIMSRGPGLQLGPGHGYARQRDTLADAG